MIKIDTKVGIDQTVAIREYHIEVELSMDKNRGMSQYDQNYRGDFRKGKLEEHKITEVRILEVDIEVALGMIILEEVEVGLEKDSIQVTL